jgi:hypothetical protein
MRKKCAQCEIRTHVARFSKKIINNKPYTYGDFDIIAVYSTDLKECLYISKDTVKGYTSSFSIQLQDEEKINTFKLFPL